MQTRAARSMLLAALCVTVATTNLAAADKAPASKPPPGYSEVTVREIKYGLGPENFLIQGAKGEGEFDLGPGSFAVDGAGNWYLIDPGRSMIEKKCVVKVFPPKGPVRLLSCSGEVHADPETKMGVTRAGTVIVEKTRTARREVPLSIIQPAGNVRTLRIALVNQDTERDEKPAVDGHELLPTVFDTLRVELGTAADGAEPLSKGDHSIREIFPAEAKEGRLLGFSSLSLRVGRGFNLRVDPEGGVYVNVSGDVRESEPGKISSVSALCRIDLKGKLTHVFPGFVENRQGRLVTIENDPLYQKHDAEITECALKFHSASGEVQRVVKFSLPSQVRSTGEAVSGCSNPSSLSFDREGRFYIGPRTCYGQFYRDHVHIYSPEGEYLGCGSWQRRILAFGAASQIQVDEAGNIYFIQFGERSAKLMKWVRQ